MSSDVVAGVSESRRGSTDTVSPEDPRKKDVRLTTGKGGQISTPVPWRLIVFQFGLSIPVLLTIPVVAAGLTTLLSGPVSRIAPASGLRLWVFWIATVPIAYAIWLILFLAICAVDVQTRCWYRGLKKVPRVSSAQGILKFYPVVSLYFRARFVYSLPMVQSYLAIPGLRWLVLWSYSNSAHLGTESYVLGMVFDPDLTDIGAGAIVGTGAKLVAHSMTTNPDGSKVLVTAPIIIGPRAVIGGEALIALGANIGADAIVEPMSHVAAFTLIGPGEVWGWTPAVFRRHRFEPCSASPTSASHRPEVVPKLSPGARSGLVQDVCCAVASALNLSVDDVSLTMSSQDCAAWDSLGQMAIASMLHSRIGARISTRDCFRLSSISEIVEYLNSCRPAEVVGTVERLPSNPELLPIFDHVAVTRLLAQENPSRLIHPNFAALRVIVAATFSAEPVVSTLKLWSHAFGVTVEFETAGFDQIPQALLSLTSSFRTNQGGLNVVLTRPEDLLSNGGDRSEELLDAIARFADDFPNMLVVSSLPPVVSRDSHHDRDRIARLRSHWLQAIGNIRGIQVLDFASIVEQIGTTVAANEDGDRLAGIPYSESVYAELGIAIARCVRCRRRGSAKVLALDADGVLWGNVLGEDGVDGIHLGSTASSRPFQQFQESVLHLKERGVLLAVVSRNQMSDVKQVFESHPGMILRSEDIAAWRVNWQPKSQNLKEIAEELNLGLDAIVFVDDDPANQLEVASHTPEVTVLPLPGAPAEFRPTLEKLWCFDAGETTHADTQRTRMILQEQDRKTLQQGSSDLESYLTSLQLRVVMRAATIADLPRVAQLTQKTHQFNLSLKRRVEAELQSLDLSHSMYVIEVADRFGDYGLVGVCVLQRPPDQTDVFEIESLLISCRALGRGVEDAVLHGMIAATRHSRGNILAAEMVLGPRNQPVADFLKRSGFLLVGLDRYSLSIENLCVLPKHIHWTGPLLPDATN